MGGKKFASDVEPNLKMRGKGMPEGQNKLAKLISKSPPELAASVKSRILSFQRSWISKARFGFTPWRPSGVVPHFTAYYPDSIRSFSDLDDLYSRWIRGNKINNNGDVPRFIALLLNLRQLQNEAIDGDFAELGVWKGNSAAILAAYAAEVQRKLYLFDTFAGFDSRDTDGDHRAQTGYFADTSIDYVKATVGHNSTTVYVPGYFPDSITPEVQTAKFALVHIDCDLYKPMKAALDFFYPRTNRGGMMILHDYSSGTWNGATQAIDEFSKATGEYISLWPDKSGTAMLRKTR
jgi:hypothetical protein